jgi:transcriptional regulator with XRE-family HTH domain
VHNRIKAVLVENRKTNNWLVEQLKVTCTTVSKWCRNEMQHRVETLFLIAKALELNIRDLLVSTK